VALGSSDDLIDSKRHQDLREFQRRFRIGQHLRLLDFPNRGGL